MTLIALLAVLGCVVLLVPAHPVRRLLRDSEVRPTRQTRRRNTTDRADAVAAMSAFGAELRAGTPPRRALELAIDPFDALCPRARLALGRHDDLPAALRADARESGTAAWASLAAVWELADVRGVSLAVVADHIVEAGQQAAAAQRLLDAELAESRATVRVLAMLPVIGMALGILLGANPLAWLLFTGPGRVVLVVAAVLEALGWFWVRALVNSVKRHL